MHGVTTKIMVSLFTAVSYKICCTAVSIINIYRSSCTVFCLILTKLYWTSERSVLWELHWYMQGNGMMQHLNMPRCDSLLAVFNRVTMTLNSSCEN